MSRSIGGWVLAAALSAAPFAAHAGGYGYDSGYGYGGYERGYGGGDYDRGAYEERGGYGYGYGGNGYGPYTAPAHYCEEHLRYHERQARMNDEAPYNDWWGTGGPEAWHEAMEADHARFHYTHPGSWRCEYQGWPSG
jgi:hypothetical protein